MLRISIAIALAIGLMIAAGAKRSRTRAKVRCGIPAQHQYQVAKYSPKRRVVSSDAIGIPAPAVERRSLRPDGVPLLTPVLGSAIPKGTAMLQQVISDRVSRAQLRDLLTQTVARLEETDPQRLLNVSRLDDATARQQLIEALQKIKPNSDVMQTMMTQAGITNTTLRGLLVTTVDSLTSEGSPMLTATTSTTTTEPLQLFSGKTFSFGESPVLRIGHCSISKMSVQVYDSGGWSVSLQADQNPNPGSDEAVNAVRDVTTAEPIQSFTEHLQRNQFFVRAYCYANYGRGRRAGALGGPTVIPLELEPFWVQKGVSHPLVVTGSLPRVRQLFQQIDRVELEFYIRTI